jgi:alpha-tubulin suppressor-like RCC1 family protein
VLLCWGSLGFGLLSPSVANYTRPEKVFSSNGATGGVTFLSMAVGDRLICGLDAVGIALCRGSYLLRDGSSLLISVPSEDRTHSLTDMLDGMTFRQLALGGAHGCGLRSSGGGAHCWGRNQYGELGDGTFVPSIFISINDTVVFTAPSVVGGLAFSAISSGGTHSCGLAEGRAYCWGQNQYGKLGAGDLPGSNAPLPVSIEATFATIDAGEDHTCGVTSAGDAYCWGANYYGQIGDGTLTDRDSPTRVVGGLSWKSITVGGRHTCGLTVDELVYCWGRNEAGQLGDGRQQDQAVPVRAISPIEPAAASR